MALHDEILTAIEDAVQAHYEGNPDFDQAKVDAQKAIQRYTFELGTLVVKQNPYVSAENLAFPTLYPEANGETRRIRKVGVLRDRHSENPLTPEESIPGGIAFPFAYENKASLHDDGLDEDVLPEEQGPTAGDSMTAVGKYIHNIIKIVRVRYAMKDRKGPNGKDSKAWMLVMYSGGDT